MIKMFAFKVLNRKKVKEILCILQNEYGLNEYWFKQKLDYVFTINDKNRLYIFNKEISLMHLEALRIDALGLYFGELKENKIRLSIEGSQLIGKGAAKNVVEINKGQAKLWTRGYDIEISEKQKEDLSENAFVIVKNENDFLGCGGFKENKILNYVPKVRRIASED